MYFSTAEVTSWSVRHAAVLGLSRVCKVCRKLPMKDGLSSVAWSKLVERETAEKDDRVSEAYKLSQVLFTAMVDLRTHNYIDQ